MTEIYQHNVEDTPEVMGSQKGLLDQFILLGDSITQQASCQDLGFAFQPALQDGKLLVDLLLVFSIPFSTCLSNCLWSLFWLPYYILSTRFTFLCVGRSKHLSRARCTT